MKKIFLITLRAARINKGLTLVQATKLLNVSKVTLIRWERGETFPNIEQIKLIEKVYGLSYNQIKFLPNKDR